MHYSIRLVRYHCTLLYRTSNPDECGITVLYTHEKVDSFNQELNNVQRNYLIENQVQKPKSSRKKRIDKKDLSILI